VATPSPTLAHIRRVAFVMKGGKVYKGITGE
jgi:hypothetical protein